MKLKLALAMGGLYLAVEMAPPAHADASDEIRAEIRRVQVLPNRTGDPDVVGFKLLFDASFTNVSESTAAIPDLDTAQSAGSIVVWAVQFRQSDGTWKYVADPPLMISAGKTERPACMPLAPMATKVAKDVSSPFLALRKQLANFGERPTVRFDLVLFCRQTDGTVLNRTVTTDPLALALPAAP